MVFPSSSGRKRAFLILSMLIFGSIGYVRRMIPLSSSVLAFARGILGSVFLLLASGASGRRCLSGIHRKQFLLLALSGCLIGFNWMLLFEAYNHTTVAAATLCYYMQPTFVILLSPVLFHESLSLRKKLCALAAFLGMFLVSGVLETGFSQDLTGILLGLGAGLLYAMVVILNKFLQGMDPFGKTIIQLSFASLSLLPGLILSGSLNSFSLAPAGVAALLIAGIVHTGIAYALYFSGMDGLPAQSIAVISYVDPVFSLFVSAVLLHERLSLFALLGAFMILGSALISEMESSSRSRKSARMSKP